ncbi:MAG: MBL fold metallo-hydrolase [Dehalococcoidales bacterium]|nr:MBL fold metallo-hydrolase [Dehalococcoidales bacterium]
MKVTILGTGAACPGAGEACSGFLVEGEKATVLVECGTGVLSRLQQYHELTAVSDIVISHIHADHFFDLIPYRYALCYGNESNDIPRPHLYLPPGGITALKQVTAPFSESDTFFEDAFDVSEYNPSEQLNLGGLEFQFIPVYHYVSAFGITITNGKKLSYSSDSGPCQGLVEVARDSELFICNTGACLESKKAVSWGHLTPEQSGQIAREAGVKHLLLTHIWSTCSRTSCLEKAAREFGGLIELAEPCHTYEV